MERIGIYGGAFNPPHLGHIRGAKYALETLGLAKILMIPSCISPHKDSPPNSPTPRQRMEMLQLALDGERGIEVSSIELDRGGTSYTWQTLQQLREQYPDAELVLLIGTDMLLSIETWMQYEKILKEASLAVFYRGEKDESRKIADKKKQLEAMGGNVYLVDNPVTEISSTQLRRMLVFGCASPFLPESVETYIRQNGLYGTAQNYRNLPMDQLEQVVVGLLKPNRVKHVLGCRDTAAELARLWGEDETLAARAGLLHDITKALDGPLQLTLCQEYGTVLDSFSCKNPKTLHALTGSLVADRIFGESKAVVDAIRTHTTGKANMNLLQKIIYVADYMEPNRDFPGVEKLRRLAHTDIDGALKLGLQMTLDMLRQQGSECSPESLEALRYLQNAQQP